MTFTGGRWNRDRESPVKFDTRVAVIGGIALVMFAVIFFRLWYLQILSGDRYLAEAQGNRVREVTVQAPRGDIRDRDGKLLVTNRTAQALQVRADELPEDARRRGEVLRRLADVAGLDTAKIRKEIREQTKELPSMPVTLKQDVPLELIWYLRENQTRYPGVTVDRVYVRRYPQGTMAAHTVGHVREIGPEELKDPRYQELEPGDEIGKDGVELTYDHVLRGLNGATRIPVDASGLPSGRPTSVREPEPGNDLVLTIDSDLQAVGESQLASFGLPGAFVAMDARNGEILAMGSNPTFDPELLTGEVTQSDTLAVYGDPDDESSTGGPAFNRAIAGGYPTGSAFKPITALAALDGDRLGINETIHDDGAYELGDGNVARNAGDAVWGPIQLRRALQVSSDVFFYTLGGRLQELIDDHEYIQDWASQLGLGDGTGIDIPGEAPGLVPNPEWRNDLYKEGLTDRPWSFGDSINLSVGQGDLQAAPLQMAVAYAAIGNGGTVVTPHVALRAEDPAGRVVQQIEPAPSRHVDIDPAWRSAIMDGLTAAAMEPEGTSYPVFGEPGFPIDVAGKTGTAETSQPEDQSWYVALAPAEDPRVVVAFTFENGGFGADTAAPATRALLTEYAQKYLSVKQRQFENRAAETPEQTGTVVFE
jgi:penicillin-binding protein 2